MRKTRFLVVALLLAAGGAWAGGGIKIPLPPIPGVNVPLPMPPVPGVAPKHRYRYFPDAEVYFDPVQSLYFFLDADVWRSAPVPPPGIVVRGLPFTDLDIDDDVPYRHHVEVRKRYPGHSEKSHGENGHRGRGHGGGHRGRGHGDHDDEN
jgi:hypothetical protein